MKYLKCAGVALASDLTFGAFISATIDKGKDPAGFFLGSFLSLIVSTIPAIGATAIDQCVHKNLFDNKTLQYGLTALEGFGLNVVMAGLVKNDGQSFTENVEKYLYEDTIFAITCGVVSITKACVFKAILDSADEQHEIDNSQDNLLQVDSKINPIQFGIDNFS